MTIKKDRGYFLLPALAVVLTGCGSRDYGPRPSTVIYQPRVNYAIECEAARQRYRDQVYYMSPDGKRIRPKDTSSYGLSALRVEHDRIFKFCGVFP